MIDLAFLQIGYDWTVKILGFIVGIISSLVPEVYLNIALIVVAILAGWFLMKTVLGNFFSEVGIGYKILLIWLLFILLKLLIVVKGVGG